MAEATRSRRMAWFKIQHKVLDGDVIVQLTDAEFGRLVKIQAITCRCAGMDCPSGKIGYGFEDDEMVGMTIAQLNAQLFTDSRAELEETIIKLAVMGLITYDKGTGIICFPDWKQYQSEYNNRLDRAEARKHKKDVPDVGQYPDAQDNVTPQSDIEVCHTNVTPQSDNTKDSIKDVPAPKLEVHNLCTPKVDHMTSQCDIQMCHSNVTSKGRHQIEDKIRKEIIIKIGKKEKKGEEKIFSPHKFNIFYSSTFGVDPSSLTVLQAEELSKRVSWDGVQSVISMLRTDEPKMPWHQIMTLFNGALENKS